MTSPSCSALARSALVWKSSTLVARACAEANGALTSRGRAAAASAPVFRTWRRLTAMQSPRRWDVARILSEEHLAGIEPRLRGERERFHVDALVVAVESAGHGFGRQRAREQSEAVRGRAVLAEVRRVGEADDQAREQLRARIVPVDDFREHLPQRRARRRDGSVLREQLLDRHVLQQIAERLVEVPAYF